MNVPREMQRRKTANCPINREETHKERVDSPVALGTDLHEERVCGRITKPIGIF